MKLFPLALFLCTLYSVQAHTDENPFSVIDDVLSANSIKSIDDLVPQLPEVYRNHFSAVYESNGLAKDFTSPKSPRILSFGNTETNLILAYSNCISDDGDYKNCDQLESVAFDEESRKTVFRVYSFPGKRSQSNEIKIEDNPKKCFGCHVGGRPLWEPYNFWHKAFGGTDGSNGELMAKDSEEYDAYQVFLSEYWNVPNKSPYTTNRYTSLSFRLSDWNPDDQKNENFVSSVHSLSNFPNRDLNLAINNINFNRINTLLIDKAKVEPKYLPILGWFSKCFKAITPSTYLLKKWQLDHGIDQLYEAGFNGLSPYATGLADMEAKFRDSFSKSLSLFLKQGQNVLPYILNANSQIYYNQSSPMLVRLFNVFGIDSTKQSTSFLGQKINFADSKFGVAHLQKMLADRLSVELPELSNRSCEALKTESRNLLVTDSN